MYRVLQIFLIIDFGGFYYSRSEAVTIATREKSRQRPTRCCRVLLHAYKCASASTLIQSESILSWLATEKHFLLFKGPGSFKKSEKYGESKCLSIDTTHTTPPFSVYCTFNVLHVLQETIWIVKIRALRESCVIFSHKNSSPKTPKVIRVHFKERMT